LQNYFISSYFGQLVEKLSLSHYKDMRTVCVCVRVRVCVWLYNCVLLQNTRGMSDDNDVCVWLYNCVFICMYA